MWYNLASQKGMFIELCNNVSKLQEKQLLYDAYFPSSILIWNIIT
jgi:uncharacterized protein YjbI with pentapeptide repeats